MSFPSIKFRNSWPIETKHDTSSFNGEADIFFIIPNYRASHTHFLMRKSIWLLQDNEQTIFKPRKSV